MELFRSVAAMVSWSQQAKAAGRTICLVPTMGCFHEGHLQLMRRAVREADLVVTSLFVNPIQFGPQEDFGCYPRDFDRDLVLAKGAGVAVLFAPEVAEMYPVGFDSRIQVGSIGQSLCGRQRPDHFNGVATVVGKLFHLVRPDSAIFGAKDYQQLAVLRRMVDDLNWGVKIIAHPIVREADGLAMSSRNRYLSVHQRQTALCLFQALQHARQLVRENREGSGPAADWLIAELIDFVKSHAGVTVEYVSLVDQYDLTDKVRVDRDTLLVMAVRIGKTRLIDNGLLCQDDAATSN